MRRNDDYCLDLALRGSEELAELDRAREVLLDGLEVYGQPAEMKQLEEECAELIVALHHLERNRPGAIAEVTEELADVLISAWQQVLILPGVAQVIKRKADRFAVRVAEDRRARREPKP